MISDLEKEVLSHDVFIASAYGATALVIVGLIVLLLWQGRVRARRLAMLTKNPEPGRDDA